MGDSNAGLDNKIIIDVGTLLAHQGAFRKTWSANTGETKQRATPRPPLIVTSTMWEIIVDFIDVQSQEDHAHHRCQNVPININIATITSTAMKLCGSSTISSCLTSSPIYPTSPSSMISYACSPNSSTATRINFNSKSKSRTYFGPLTYPWLKLA